MTKTLAEENKVPFEDLCVYALGAAQQEKDNAAAAASQETKTTFEATGENAAAEPEDSEDSK